MGRCCVCKFATDGQQKDYSKDWPNISGKPFDHPFGPYTDNFSEEQHKYGPFDPIRLGKRKKQDKMNKDEFNYIDFKTFDMKKITIACRSYCWLQRIVKAQNVDYRVVFDMTSRDSFESTGSCPGIKSYQGRKP